MMEDRSCEIVRNLEDRAQQDNFSEFIWNEIEAGVNSTMNAGEVPLSPLLRCSPEPECAICLETVENKGVTDSCFHTFCFLCLQKWSKIKAECPLCKQPFKSILHNIRSAVDYDEYHITTAKNADTSWRESSDFASELWFGRGNYQRLEDTFEYAAYEMNRASRSVSFPSERNLSGNPSTTTIIFRRHVYENGLWVKPFRYENVQSHRINYAEFYHRYPQYVSLLRPWLNRELFALLSDRPSQIPLVLDLIISLMPRYDIRSEEFFFHVVPYFQHRTSHFVHEFLNFASSLYEMEMYDLCAVYENLTSESGCSAMSHTARYDVNPVTSSSSITFSENIPSVCIIYASGSSCLYGRNTVSCSERKLKYHSRNIEDNNQHSTFPLLPQSLQSTSEHPASSLQQRFPDQITFPGPSTSVVGSLAKTGHKKCFSYGNSVSVCFPDDDSDDYVSVVSPKNSCTPELIDLVSSSSEDENVTFYNSSMATQSRQNSGSFLQKELKGQGAMAINVNSSDHMLSSPLVELTRPRSLTPGPQLLASLFPYAESMSPAMSVSTNKRKKSDKVSDGSKCIENSEMYASHQGIADSSQLYGKDSVASHIFFDTGGSETVCNSGKVYSAREFNGKDALSFPVNETYSKNSSDITMDSSIEEVPGLNGESQSSVKNSVNNQNKCYQTWQYCSSSVESGEGGGMFKDGGHKRKLCSVVCKPPTSSQQSSHGGHKRHKKKQKKHKHHHRPHFSGTSSQDLQKCKHHRDKKGKKCNRHRHRCHLLETPPNDY